ncbi:MAG: hypothetical protein ACK50A_10490 [Sphingobacteriaceae bacterium]
MKQLFIILFFFLSIRVFSQVDNTSLYQNQYIDTLDEEMPYFKLQGLGYQKDIENFGPMMDGYTIFGFQFNPQLGYQVSKNVCVEGGVYLRKDFGYKDFNEVLPTFSIRYHKNDFKMIFGNLDGSLNHGLIEPIYAFERFMTNRMENGVQYILTKKKFDAEVWIDWQNVLYRLVDDYERLVVGVSTNAYKLKSDRFELKIPIQGTGRHNGGQIARGGTLGGPDTEGVYTNINGSAGLYYKYIIGKKHFDNMYIDMRYVGNLNNSRDSLIYKKFGDGMMANVGMNVYGTDIMLTYWYGSDYTSEFGGDLYSSLSSSITYAGTYKSYRNLLMLRFTSKFTLAKHITLTLRTEPQFDLDFRRFNCDFGFYLNFDKRVNLKK